MNNTQWLIIAIIAIIVLKGIEKLFFPKKEWIPYRKWKSRYKYKKPHPSYEEDDEEEPLSKQEKERIYCQYMFSKGDIFTQNERNFFHQLQDTLRNTNFLVFTHVRLWDIIDVNKWKAGSYYREARNTINQKHIDFVITSSEGKILCCIELDDSTHDEYQPNDETKNLYLEKVKIPLKRYKVRNNYDF